MKFLARRADNLVDALADELPMTSESVYSRAMISWQLALAYGGKMLHFLTRAILLSLASAGMGLAWLCCWIDNFRCGKSAGAWMIPGQAVNRRDAEQRREMCVAQALLHSQPRTIDEMIRSRSARA